MERRIEAWNTVAAALLACTGAAGQTCGPAWIPGGFSSVTLPAQVDALAVLPSGEVILGGTFTDGGGVIQATYICRWNGFAWSRYGVSFPFQGWGESFASAPGGALFAGGHIPSLGGPGLVAVSTASGWSTIGYSDDSTSVFAVAVLPGGDVIAGGDFVHMSGVSAVCLARWHASHWFPMGEVICYGASPSIRVLLVTPGGDLIAGGTFSAINGVAANNIARWDGNTWSPFGPGLGYPFFREQVCALLVMPNGDLVAGGTFSTSGSATVSGIARWDGSAWSPLSYGVGGVTAPATPGVKALALSPGGDLIAGGSFTTAGGSSANNIARWNGLTWDSLGTGLGRPGNTVMALAALPSGEIAAAGDFDTAGGQYSPMWARWTETRSPWVALQPPRSLSPAPGGHAVLATAAASGYGASYRWRRNESLLSNGVTPQGSSISGATTSTLTITNVQAEDAGSYDCVVSSACGSVNSQATTLAPCYANCDDSTVSPVLNINDFTCFLNRFGAGEPYCNCDGSTQAPALNVNDFLCFVNRYASGCP